MVALGEGKPLLCICGSDWREFPLGVGRGPECANPMCTVAVGRKLQPPSPAESNLVPREGLQGS